MQFEHWQVLGLGKLIIAHVNVLYDWLHRGSFITEAYGSW